MELLSTKQMAEKLTNHGVSTRASLLRLLDKIGAYSAHKSARGELLYTDDDREPLAALIEKAPRRQVRDTAARAYRIYPISEAAAQINTCRFHPPPSR
jgi:hypothetical protein